MNTKREFDNNPKTNKMHIYNNMRVINKIVLDYEEGGFDNVSKSDVDALGRGFYQFMINRIKGSDFDIFANDIESRANYVQLSYYKKDTEYFATDMYIYHRVCSTMETMYLRIYEQGDKMSKMLMYKFIRHELESVLDIELEPDVNKFAGVLFMYDLLKVIEKIVSSKYVPDNDMTDILNDKVSVVLKLIHEVCSDGGNRIHLKRMCNDADNITEHNIRRMIGEIAKDTTRYGLKVCRGGKENE